MSIVSTLGKRLIRTFLFACMLLGLHSAPALANVASVSISAPNATQGVATSITVSGSSQLARNLYVYLDPNDKGCEFDPAFETVYASPTVLANGTAVGPGAFSETYSYTPAAANANYELCAYVDDTPSDTADAHSDVTFTTSLPATTPISPPTTAPTRPTKVSATRPKPKSSSHRGSSEPSEPSGPIAISRSGQIGSLAINRSTASAIRSVWGSPDYTKTGNVDSVETPNYLELGYSCHPSHGYVACAVSFYVSQHTHRLESFTTTTPRFTLFGGARVGMASNAASRREHEPNISGCFQGIFLNTHNLIVVVQTHGGHEHATRRGNSVSGGSVSAISIDEKPLGVGVNFC